MFKEILEYIINFLKSRIFILSIIVFLLFSILMVRIFDLQIVNEEYYLNNYIQIAEKEVKTSGTRGLIYDRNGEILAYNKLAYAVEIEDELSSSYNKSERLNEIIAKTVDIILGNGDTLIHNFSIILNSNGEYEFSVSSETAKLGFLRDIYGKKSIAELDNDKETLSISTADDVMDYLCSDERFDISKDYSKEQRLYIAMIRYNLSLNSFQKYISTKISSNVSEETVAAIYESQAELKGVSIKEETIRVYNHSIYFSHIIGYTGSVSETQLAELNADGGDYDSSDVVGKSGIERHMESDLKGTKGKQTILTDSTGKITDILEETEAKAGNDVYLTIDAKLQKAGYTILEQKLAGIIYSKLVNYDVNVTENMKEIPIPIKDVYFQLINNNVLDLSTFGNEDSSDTEKSIYNTFISRQSDVINRVNAELTDISAQNMSSLSEEIQEYLNYIYDNVLKNKGILNKTAIDYEDEMYLKWDKGDISLQQFLRYAISKNWIITSKIIDSSESKYSDTDEIYNKLIENIVSDLYSDKGFSKKIYYYLIYGGKISGNQLCIALFDQGVLEYDENAYRLLLSGYSAFEFMKEQIRLINITPAQLALDPCSGSLVVTDPYSGDVLALVTYPSYDNNMLSGTVDAVYWNKINNDLSLPLYNRATQTRTAPGSTFKMLSAITGLEEGLLYPGRTIVGLGEFTKITPSAKCWRYPGSHGAINVSQALSVSCNYFFYEVGYELSLDNMGNFKSDLGISKLYKYGSLMGLTTLSGVEMEENDPLFSTDNSVRTAIGQGSNSFANIQLARYTNTITNGGNNYELTVLDKVATNTGEVVKNFEPVLTNTTDFSDSTWNAVYSGMRMVVTSGTAKGTFNGFPIEVAGKSGTAQENKLRSNHSLFVAYAPYKDPEIALSVLIPNGESSGYTAEVIRDMIKYYYNLTTDEELYGGVASIPTSGVTND
ncbi:MAG: hypothetical protein IJA34_13275 [Lachnospiraceae bacterium]|nr:hypothetical protein [Lachnospiraceae bacterium]